MKPNEFITSDHHWGHARVIEYSNRPFSSVEEMDENMILAWNRKIPSKGAIVYHLGDFSFHNSERTKKILNRLHGTIRLIRGNHDKPIKGDLLSYFDWVKDYYESTTEEGKKIVMCHYPLMTWNKSHYGSYHFHGHSHGSLRAPETTRLDVGVDTTKDFAPYSYSEIMEVMKNRKHLSCDHHKRKE